WKATARTTATTKTNSRRRGKTKGPTEMDETKYGFFAKEMRRKSAVQIIFMTFSKIRNSPKVTSRDGVVSMRNRRKKYCRPIPTRRKIGKVASTVTKGFQLPNWVSW